MVVAAMPVTMIMGADMRAVVVSVIVHPRGPIGGRQTHDTSSSTGSVWMPRWGVGQFALVT